MLKQLTVYERICVCGGLKCECFSRAIMNIVNVNDVQECHDYCCTYEKNYYNVYEREQIIASGICRELVPRYFAFAKFYKIIQ